MHQCGGRTEVLLHLFTQQKLIHGWVLLSFLCLSTSPRSLTPSTSILFSYSNSCCRCTQLQQASLARSRSAAIRSPGNLEPIAKCRGSSAHVQTQTHGFFFFFLGVRCSRGSQRRWGKEEVRSSPLKPAWHTWLWFTESWGTKLKMSRLICVPVHLSISTTTCPPRFNETFTAAVILHPKPQKKHK